MGRGSIATFPRGCSRWAIGILFKAVPIYGEAIEVAGVSPRDCRAQQTPLHREVVIAAFMWLGFFLFSRAFRMAYGANAGVVIRKVPFSFIFRPTDFLMEKASTQISASSKLAAAAASKRADFFKGWAMRSVFLNVGLPALMLFLAFGLGFAQSWPVTGEVVWSTIMLNDGPPISGRVLRAGERGLLFFNAQDQSVEFRPWDQIKRIKVKDERSPVTVTR